MKKILATAPLLLLAYGIVRLIDGADGNHGPGRARTIGHLLFLAGFLLYAAVLVGLRRLIVRGRGLATVAVVARLIGVVAFVRVIVSSRTGSRDPRRAPRAPGPRL
jgi:multisubunit Na+/H+ antiporter MnhG subunit